MYASRTSSRRGRQRSSMSSSRRRCPCFEAAERRLGSVHRVHGARGGGGVAPWRRRTQRSSVNRAGPRPRSAGGLPAAREHRERLARGLPLLRYDPRRRSCSSWLDEIEPRRRSGSVPPRLPSRGRWRCSGASTRRARSSPKRGRSRQSAERERLLAGFTAFESVWVELWPVILPPQPSSEQKAAGCSRSSASERLPLRPRPSYLAQALYGLDRLDEAEAWAGRAAELGASDDALDGAGSGARSRRRCSHAVASTPRRSDSHARRSRSETTTEHARRPGRCVRRPRGGAPARRKARRRRRRARAGARRYERKENLASAGRDADAPP